MHQNRWAIGLEVGAAIATIVAVLVSEDVRRLLARQVSLPIWLLLLAFFLPVALVMIFGRRHRAATANDALASSGGLILNEEPKLIEGSRPESGDTIGSSPLKTSQGTFATWIYLHPFDQGIRRLVNNRYVLACVAKASKPYSGVIAFCWSPMKWDPPRDPTWKVWLANSEGKGKSWSYPDSREFQTGWRLFVLRWNHSVPRLELLIDGRSVIIPDDYYSFWPRTYSNRLVIGHWPGTYADHYIDTYLWRTQFLPYYVSDEWIDNEKGRRKPTAPV